MTKYQDRFTGKTFTICKGKSTHQPNYTVYITDKSIDLKTFAYAVDVEQAFKIISDWLKD